MKVPHRVSLNDAMIAVLKECARLNGCTSEADCTGLVFRSPQGMRMPDARLRETLHKLGRTETVHGFRSSFSQWAKEQGIRYEAYEPNSLTLSAAIWSAYTVRRTCSTCAVR